MRYRCWIPADGDTRETAADVDARSPGEAAEAHAEQVYNASDSDGIEAILEKPVDVSVALWGSGTSSAETWRVWVELEPTFDARRQP